MTFFRRGNFNPRPHTGATTSAQTATTKAGISIHAPIRGRRHGQKAAGIRDVFQSTPPYGGDPPRVARPGNGCYFNPRPHTGATGLHDIFLLQVFDFNPRPHTGATMAEYYSVELAEFQSTPPYGGDGPSLHLLFLWSHFNPRPHTGATQLMDRGGKLTEFQSTPPYGGDVQLAEVLVRLNISIHAPIRGRQRLIGAA